MNSKVIHRILGLCLLLPLLAWAATGAVFILKPGYASAYAQIGVKPYSLDQAFSFKPHVHWRKVSIIRSVLGTHLLVDDAGTLRHLDPITLQPQAVPDHSGLVSLFNDAISIDAERYGEVLELNINTPERITATTSTGVELSLNWQNLALRQSGTDTRIISLLYKIHYLQWWGEKTINKAFAVLALLSLLVLSILGLLVYIRKPKG